MSCRGRLGALLASCLVAGCATSPRPPAAAAAVPAAADPSSVAEAVPRLEPVRSGGPNKPYSVLGRDYVPLTGEAEFSERGLASWYGRPFHGRPTALGETYDMYAMTAAHPTLPIPSYARVRNPANGREVVVRINDRGPFHAGRIVDLSYVAAARLDLLRGVAPVELVRITPAEIRSGVWPRPSPERRDLPAVVVAAEAGTAGGDDLVAAEPSSSPFLQASPAARGFWIQLGAFRDPTGAAGFQRHVGAELGWLAPLLATVSDPTLHRVQAGPYASRDEAAAAAARVRDAMGVMPLIVDRRGR